MDSCKVCCETYNKTIHKKVECPFCYYDACKSCVQTYLLSIIQEPHCMKCKREINRGFIDSFCTKRFRNVEYKKHREKVLFEREKLLIPETQPEVERIIRIRELREMYYDKLNALALIERRKRDSYARGMRTIEYDDMEGEIRQEIEDITSEMNRLRYMHINEDAGRNFIRACPSSECRGYIDADWKCGLCKKNFCVKCNEILDSEHVCDPNNVETMKLINKDTRPCPKCSTMISKIDGCMQMWCTNCKTAFDWRTGKIELGRIHNPHFFEFKKRTREHGDIPCGGRPSISELREANAPEFLLEICILLYKMDHELIYKYGEIYDANNMHLRIQYLLQTLTEHQFITELQRRDKLKEKFKDIRDVYEMFTNSCGDILRQWVIDTSLEITSTIKELMKYTNDVIHEIHTRYNSKTPSFIGLP